MFQQSGTIFSRRVFSNNSRRLLTGLAGIQLGAAVAVISDKELNKKPSWYPFLLFLTQAITLKELYLMPAESLETSPMLHFASNLQFFKKFAVLY